MANMDQLIAFQATICLLNDMELKDIIARQYRMAKKEGSNAKTRINYVKELYAPFTDEEISAQIARMLTPAGTQSKVEIIFQTLEGLHDACPHHMGDWYFSGDYPTSGGIKLLNDAFISYIDKNSVLRDYDKAER